MFGLFGKVADPVCKMGLNRKEAKLSREVDGQKFYFCSQNCKKKFDANPKKYVSEKDHAGGCCH